VHELIMLQRDRDAETRAVLSLIHGGDRSPDSDVTRSRSGDQVRPAVPSAEGDVAPAPKPKLLPRLR
jgi:hypothetical protein